MGHLDRLLDTIGEYMKIKKEQEGTSIAPCLDWDCGLATEFNDSFLDPEHRKRLDSARSAFEEALNHYIDARIRAVMKKDGCRE